MENVYLLRFSHFYIPNYFKEFLEVGQLRDLILERTEIERAISVQFRHVFLLKRNWKLVKKFGSWPPSPIAFSLDLLDLEPWIERTDKKWRKSGENSGILVHWGVKIPNWTILKVWNQVQVNMYNVLLFQFVWVADDITR